jgi:peptide/nickel transport system substrate-binding protein
MAKPGGTIRDFQTADFPHFDVLSTAVGGVTAVASAGTYSKMVKYATEKYPAQPDGSVEPDLTEGFEVSPDGLTVTFKVRQGAKWDSRPPTSGRVIDAADFIFSWDKFVNLNQDALGFWYDSERSPQGSVESLQATDDSTIVMKLHRPDPALFDMLASFNFWIMPRESDGQFDPAKLVRGHGPYRVAEYVPSVRIVYEKNPDYYLEDRPFPDRWEKPIVAEYASQLAQFRAGNIMTNIFGRVQEDITPTKADIPDLLLLNDGYFDRNYHFFTFGYEGDIGQSPFKDQRLRQAASMLIDREGYLSAIEPVDIYAKAGIELETAFQTVVAAGWTQYYLDPQSTEFGPAGKYLEFNPSEAKKLMSAAGYANGVEAEMFYLQAANYASWNYSQKFEVMSQMLREGGVNLKLTGLDYENYLNNYYFGYLSSQYLSGQKKGYTGIAFLLERPWAALEINLFANMHKDGAGFHGMTPNGEDPHLGDPKVNDLVSKIRTTLDKEDQVGMVNDLARYMTEQAYYIPNPTTSKPLSLWWPAIGNLGVDVRYLGIGVPLNWWVDSTKPPLA